MVDETRYPQVLTHFYLNDPYRCKPLLLKKKLCELSYICLPYTHTLTWPSILERLGGQ